MAWWAGMLNAIHAPTCRVTQTRGLNDEPVWLKVLHASKKGLGVRGRIGLLHASAWPHQPHEAGLLPPAVMGC